MVSTRGVSELHSNEARGAIGYGPKIFLIDSWGIFTFFFAEKSEYGGIVAIDNFTLFFIVKNKFDPSENQLLDIIKQKWYFENIMNVPMLPKKF